MSGSKPPGTESSEELREALLLRVEAGEWAELDEKLGALHPSDLADLLESIDDPEARRHLVRVLPVELASEALAEMEEGDARADLLAGLAPEKGAELLHELADDDAADLIAELEPDERQRILEALPLEAAGELKGLLLYEEDTAGGLMTTALVSVESRLSAGDAIAAVRVQGREVEDFYSVFVVDGEGRLLGTVSLDDLILADPDEPVGNLIEPVVATVLPDIDQEEVGRILSRYNLVSVPVVNELGVLLGRITFDDVIDVIEAEQTEDILRLAGLSEEEEIRAGWGDAVRSRLPWLFANLATAAVAASVIALFSETIERFWFIAMIMPIVAGMGGNAGTQALAVTTRRIALSDGPMERKRTAVGKEMAVGLVNGLALGLVAAVAAGLMVGLVADPGGPGAQNLLDPVGAAAMPPDLPVDPMTFGFVVLFAMWGNILIAGFAGAFIPTVLDRVGVDPAVASSVFVTTLTDLVGFFLLLGLASSLLLP